VILAPVAKLSFADAQPLSWTATPDATHWNTYRGTLPRTGMGSRPNPYDHVCFESDDSADNGALISVDIQDPPPGAGFYYDVTGENACGEGPLGKDFDGTVRPLATPCPTPP
jgi:hypothetical protein